MFSYSPKYQDVLRSVLYEQEIHYPEGATKKSAGKLDPFMQRTGQLMGSTLSFPILCAINLCAYWAALEELTGREFDVHDLPVLVNGDDILFRTDDRLYEIWLRKIAEVGFELSLGKNYVHPNYLTVNSQLYYFNEKKSLFIPLGYLRAGLLTGQSKITGRQEAKAAPLWDYFNKVTRDALNPIRAKKRFISYHRETIERLTQKGKWNLFASPMKGGLGFEPVEGDKLRFTPFQRRWADYMDWKLRNDPDKFGTISLIQPRSSKDGPRVLHNPQLIVQPKYGPYEEGVVEIKDTTIPLQILAARLEINDADDMKSSLRVKFPKKETLEEFRSRNWRQLKGSLSCDRFRLMEKRSEMNSKVLSALRQMDNVDELLQEYKSTGTFNSLSLDIMHDIVEGICPSCSSSQSAQESSLHH
jgi:hypothetical protein